MAETRTKVQLPAGPADGYIVPITESTERWCELKLEDGAIIRVKPNILKVMRVDNMYDPEGNPVYALQSVANMTIVSVPPSLRKDAGAGASAKAN